VAAAAREFPYLLGGPGRSVSEIVAATPGLLAKDGAEGVWGAALPDGRALAVKIDDGALRALPVVLSSVVQAWGFSLDDVLPWEDDVISGGGEPVGTLRPSPELADWLAQNA
jgi:L-asparaginase II